SSRIPTSFSRISPEGLTYGCFTGTLEKLQYFSIDFCLDDLSIGVVSLLGLEFSF
ncbi:hypothetical protein STEG23_035417, partial [Scotinomys teguina]